MTALHLDDLKQYSDVLRAKNGRTVADGGELYWNRAACRAAIVRIKRLVRLASIVVETQ